jgi:hypothetical protein
MISMKLEQPKNSNLNKRKREEDVEGAGPSKIPKRDHPKNSTRPKTKGLASEASGVSYALIFLGWRLSD